MKLALSFGALCLTLLFDGCRALPEPVCQSTVLVPIVQARGPRTATVNQTVTYQLRYALGNTCGTFDQYVTSSDTTTARIRRRVGANVVFNGCTCASTDTASTRATYQFQPRRAGTYYVQFLTNQGLFLTDTLTVR